MTAALAPAPALTLGEIAALEADTRARLTDAIGNLTRLREGSAHQVADFPSWAGYVLARFGDLLAQLKLPREERLALVASLDDAGMKVQEVAERLGVSVGTVQNDRTKLGRVIPIGPRRKAAATDARPWGQRWARAAELIRAEGDHGMTLVELARAMGITEGSASGLLAYLGPASAAHPQRKGLVIRTEERRSGQRVHIITESSAVTAAP